MCWVRKRSRVTPKPLLQLTQETQPLIWKQAHHRVDTESIHSSLSIYSATTVGKEGAGQFHSNYFLRFVLFHFRPLPTPAHIETFNKCGFLPHPRSHTVKWKENKTGSQSEFVSFVFTSRNAKNYIEEWLRA